jgi:hypothetical protein
MTSSVKQIVEFNYDVRIPALVSPYSQKETTDIFTCSDTLTFPLILDILPIRIHSVNPVGALPSTDKEMATRALSDNSLASKLLPPGQTLNSSGPLSC